MMGNANNTRSTTLSAIRTAGYHGRPGELARLLVGASPWDRALARRAYSEGVQARASGVSCGCPECTRGAAA